MKPIGVVNLEEKRQEKTVQRIRVIQKVGVMINNNWVWNEYELSPSQIENAPMEKLKPVVLEPKEKPKQPAMTMGRDPEKFLITFGKYRGKYIGDIDQYELNSYYENMKDTFEPSPQLEVALEMMSAHLDAITRPAYFTEPRKR